VLAAHLLGLDEVPCIVLAHLTPAQRRAYVLADNKLALNAGWDLEMLSLEIGELGEAGFDLSLTGFDEFELGELFAERTQGRTDPDDAPEPPAHPVAEPGDLWVRAARRARRKQIPRRARPPAPVRTRRPLTPGHHRVDCPAGVVGDQEPLHRDVPGLRIDAHDADRTP
jgi:ParB-like chromosome segregation protein Spo0J